MAIPDPKRFPYAEKVGSYNEPPSPMEECPIGEYWYQMMFCSQDHQEYRHVCFTENKWKLTPCWIFWFQDVAYLIHVDGIATYTKGEPNRFDSMKCYRIGCKHDWKETKIEMCLTNRKCTKCGLSYDVDSSD